MPETGYHDKTIADGGKPSPAATIVTPTKNRRALLSEAIASVRAQTFPDWEHLVIDDGSDDGTEEMVAKIAAVDPRIRFLRREGERAGANVCRNLGIREARGEFLVFLDSDDLLAPGCLKGRVEVMRRNLDLDFAVFRADVFVESPELPGGLWHPQTAGDDLNRFLQHECIWDITGPFWRRTVFEKFGVFNNDLLSMQDYDLHIRVLAKGAKYLKFTDIDHHIRGHNFDAKTSARHFKDPTFLRRVQDLPNRFRDQLTEADLLTWSRRRLLGGLVFANAENWAKAGYLNEAWRVWWSALGTELIEARVAVPGLAALALLRMAPNDGGIAQRAVAKWKGWVRFRQEPSLIRKKNGSL